MQEIDYIKHNEEVAEVWDSYLKGLPIRIPMILGLSSRYFIFNSEVNPENLTYADYLENPDVMFDIQVKSDFYRRMNIPADYEMGIPKKGWKVMIDFQNHYEAVWLGAGLQYIEGNVPAIVPFLSDNNKNIIFDKGIPDAFSGLMNTGREYYEHFKEKARNYRFQGAGIDTILPAFMASDGPFTIACNIRGTTEFCLDLVEDPVYAHSLLELITEATIQRIKQWRRYLGGPETEDGFSFADDSIVLLSNEMYREFILPYHRKLIDALSTGKKSNSIHLCGNSSRFFKILRDELDIKTFDTGFPIKHGELVKELGSDTTVYGGPHIELLRSGTEREIDDEVKRICSEVKDVSKRFVLREGNNMAPWTPLRNICAMYEACRKYGSYNY